MKKLCVGGIQWSSTKGFTQFVAQKERLKAWPFRNSYETSMRLIIQDTYDKASEWAAKYVRNRILKFNPGPGRHFVLGLPTGI